MSKRPQAIISVINDIVTDQRVFRIASTLQKAGYEVLIVGRITPGSPVLYNFPFHIKRFRLLINKGPLFYVLYNVRLLFFLLSRRFNILWSCDLDTLLPNFVVSKIRNSFLVYDSHELFTEVPELVNRRNVQKIWLSIEKLLLPHIKHSCTVSNGVAFEYKKRYGIDMVLVRNVPFYKPTKKVEQISSSDKKKIVIYQGAINLNRGIEKVVLAFKYIENAEFWIVGTGDIDHKISKLIIDEKLSDKVKMLGRIVPEKLQEITPQAHLGISLEENTNLNYYYALPNKLFDYIQARIPVLVSDFPDMAGIVKHYNIGVTTNEFNPVKLALIISKMLIDTESRVAWRRNLETAANELCWEHEEIKILNAFR